MKLQIKISTALLLPLLVIVSSCSKSPEPINYNSDECEYCHMQIVDNQFAAEIVTDKGKVYKFDSIECLAGFALVKNLVEDQNQNLYVNDFNDGGNFLDIRKSFFTHNPDFCSPMGLNVQTFKTKTEAEKFVKENGGAELNWNDVIKLVKDSEM